jgi:hypothetical protein
MLATLSALLPANSARADAIVYRNDASIIGVASVLENGLPAPGSVGHFFDPAGGLGIPTPSDDWPLPTTGTWSVSDSVTYSERGATATIAASVSGTLAPRQFTGSGLTTSTASADGAAAGIGAQTWGHAGFNIGFELTEPHTFAYTAHYFGEGDSLFSNVGAGLQPELGGRVFLDTFSFFTALDETRSHMGILGPGRYQFFAVSHPAYVTAPENSRKVGGFDFTLDLSPVEPIPEPATVLLVAAGLAGVVRRSRRRSSSGQSLEPLP